MWHDTAQDPPPFRKTVLFCSKAHDTPRIAYVRNSDDYYAQCSMAKEQRRIPRLAPVPRPKDRYLPMPGYRSADSVTGDECYVLHGVGPLRIAPPYWRELPESPAQFRRFLRPWSPEVAVTPTDDADVAKLAQDILDLMVSPEAALNYARAVRAAGLTVEVLRG